MTDEQFKEFFDGLKAIGSLSNNRSKLGQSTELKNVILGIERIRDDQFERLKAYGLLKAELQADLNSFFDPVFSSPGGQILTAIKEMTGNFFYLKKSFQLSHLDNVHRQVFKTKDEFSDYFYLQLFTDYFETLTNRIKGISIAFHPLEEKLAKMNAFEVFKKLKVLGLLPTLEDIMISDTLRPFRNTISHGQFICEGKKISAIVDSAKAVQVNQPTQTNESRRTEYYTKTQILIVYHILFSTEFDLRFFQLPLSPSSIDMELWQEYYQLYLSSWITQQEITNQASAHS